MSEMRRTGHWMGCLAIVVGLGCAGGSADLRASESSAASAGDEARAAEDVSPGRRRTSGMERLRSRDAVVIPMRPQDDPRFDPRFGTLLQVNPRTHSLPGIR
jgi:hypothetical protein